MDRLQMAHGLMKRAAQHVEWIGDDHGDRYETALILGNIDVEMQIVAKEALDHLRSALDYCAREVWQELSGQPNGAIIYFPIAREGANKADFPSIMNRKMPGVRGASELASNQFAKFQEFSNEENAWLPELATLANSVKHEHLSVARFPEALLHIRKNSNGASTMSFEPGHGPKRHSPWMILTHIDGSTEEHSKYEARYMIFNEVNVELSHFFKEALRGVEKVILSCERLLERNLEV